MTPKITLNFHDYYVPELIGNADADANQFLIRGLVPHKLGGLPQLFRFTVPVVTNPTGDDGHDTGLGDTTLMDLFVIPKKPFEFGIGPLVVIPGENDPVLSSEKWQIGAAGIAVAPQRWGLLGGLVTFQQSVGGSSSRDSVTLLTVQPLAIYNLPDGWYLRSTGTWNFDMNAGTHYVPVGIGAGQSVSAERQPYSKRLCRAAIYGTARGGGVSAVAGVLRNELTVRDSLTCRFRGRYQAR